MRKGTGHQQRIKGAGRGIDNQAMGSNRRLRIEGSSAPLDDRPILAAPTRRFGWRQRAIVAFILLAVGLRLILWWNQQRFDIKATRISDPPLVEVGSGQPRGELLDGGIYFAPMADFPPEALDELADYYEESWELDVRVLSPITIEASAKPSGNSQLDAFELVDQIQRAYLLDSKPAGVIGFVTYDVRAYPTDDFWNFGAVNPSGYAVISTARMNPLSFGEPADEDLLVERLRKMTTRYIALTYVRLPYSADPRSVLYKPIRSVQDLDRLGEYPCPDKPRRMETC